MFDEGALTSDIQRSPEAFSGLVVGRVEFPVRAELHIPDTKLALSLETVIRRPCTVEGGAVGDTPGTSWNMVQGRSVLGRRQSHPPYDTPSLTSDATRQRLANLRRPRQVAKRVFPSDDLTKNKTEPLQRGWGVAPG